MKGAKKGNQKKSSLHIKERVKDVINNQHVLCRGHIQSQYVLSRWLIKRIDKKQVKYQCKLTRITY